MYIYCSLCVIVQSLFTITGVDILVAVRKHMYCTPFNDQVCCGMQPKLSTCVVNSTIISIVHVHVYTMYMYMYIPCSYIVFIGA